MGSSESSIPMDDSQGEASNSTARNQEEFAQDQDQEDPWWWEIENQNLLLNVVSDELDSAPSTSAEALARNVRGDGERIMIRNKLASEAPRPGDRECVCDSASTVLEKSARIESEINASVQKEQTLEQFKEELKAKRMARQTAVNELREEIQSLRRQLAEERDVTRHLRSDKSAEVDKEATPSDLEEHRKKLLEESDRVLAQQIFDDDVVAGSTNPKVQLAEAQLALQLANADNLSLTTELGVTRKQVTSLKEVVACCKQMIAMKEEQVVQLKGKLQEIEESLAERELKLMSDKLRQEYDRQLANMRTLRQLYEERARVSAAERDNLQRQISMKKDELEVEKEKTKSVEECSKVLEKDLEITNHQLLALKEQCNEYRFENKTLKEEMGAVNKFFSQMLMGFNGTNNLDIDRLTTMLEENRTLLNDMATKEANSDGATLPKLLFELVQQAAVTNHHHPLETEFESNLDRQTNQPDDEEHKNIPEITRYPPTTATISASHHPTRPTTNVCGQPSIDGISCVKSTPTDAEQMTTIGGSATTNTSTTTDTNDEPCSTSRQASESLPKQHYDGDNDEKAGAEEENPDRKQSPPEVMAKVASAEEIIGNLPKVWKVLMELLSHHKIERVQFRENGQGEDCFKSVETPNGPKAELSVSKTYIKLKDLILEKKSLVKETNRLKTLNCHLEFRLNEQEKRLSAVSLELQKTWHLVNKMQRQHRQLHTQEQILRYQLQQKRRLLYELKDELEYCRRKWAAARAKNDESQLQCDDLRREFAKRKLLDAHNSAESGYSDGPGSDEDDQTAVAKDVPIPKNWEDIFEVRKTIKRMQSTSPGRSAHHHGDEELRWSSAPPLVNCPIDDSLLFQDDDQPSTSSGARRGPRMSRSKLRGVKDDDDDDCQVDESPDGSQTDRATRIQRLEEQCKSLIAAVIETSGNRERLEVQLCRFQDEIAPAQYPIPLDEYIANKAMESMKRASSAPEISKADQDCLTPRELEYTRRRSERLERLEEESRQLMNRIKRTSARGNSLRSSLERIHARRNLSREGSFESNTEEVTAPEEVTNTTDVHTGTGLTATEEEYTSKRAERLRRLEEESKALLSKLSKNSERGTVFNSKLDALHQKYGSEEREPSTSKSIDDRLKNVAEISVNRQERLRILEEEGRQLIDKLTNTANRGAQMIDRIKGREESKNLRASLEHPADTEALASSIPPTPKTVASSSIVSEEITERVVITRTPSQIALSQDTTEALSEPCFSQPIEKSAVVVPHSSTKLCAASGRKRVTSSSTSPSSLSTVARTEPASETLEQMVRRLRNLPFPSDNDTNGSHNDRTDNPNV